MKVSAKGKGSKVRDYRDWYVEMVENSLIKVMFARPNVSDYNDPGDIYETRMLDFKTEDIGYVTFTGSEYLRIEIIKKLIFVLAMVNFVIKWSRCFPINWFIKVVGEVTVAKVCFFSLPTAIAKSSESGMGLRYFEPFILFRI